MKFARKEVYVYTLFHLLAKNLVENGANKSIGMKILGQKTGWVFDHYANHVDKETFNLMSTALESVRQPENVKILDFMPLKANCS